MLLKTLWRWVLIQLNWTSINSIFCVHGTMSSIVGAERGTKTRPHPKGTDIRENYECYVRSIYSGVRECCGLKTCAPPAPTPNVMVFGDGAFGRWSEMRSCGQGLGLVGFELLEEETSDSLPFCPLPHLWCGHAQQKRSCEHMASKGSSASQEESLHQKAILSAPWSWTSSLQNCGRIKIHCLSHPVYGILL